MKTCQFNRSVLLIVVLVLLTTTIDVKAQYSGGTGEPNAPYQIATAADLILLGETPDDYDKHFILTADINLVTLRLSRAWHLREAGMAPEKIQRFLGAESRAGRRVI